MTRLSKNEKETNTKFNEGTSIYGYIRVSSRDQNEDRQMIALRELSVPEKNVFMDK